MVENWLKSQEEEVRSSTLHYPLETLNLSTINISSQTRLPKQQIPSFYVEPLMFQSFWEIFDSSVNSNPNLDKIFKFSYPKGLLKDKASDAILGLSLPSEDYGEAVAILKYRFSDPQIVIQTNMDVLLSLPDVESCSHIRLLRKILDVIKTTSRNLRPHNIDSNHYGPILILVINLMEKLPEEFRLELSRQMPVGKLDLAKFLEVFSKELASRERCQSIKSSEISSQNIGSQGLNSGFILHVAYENHNRNPTKITCTYCRQNHTLNRCRAVTDNFARKKILQDKSKCYNCLKTGHVVKNCTSQHCCFACKRKHHISICESKINPVKKDHSSENQAPQNEMINSKVNNNEPGSSSSSTTLLIDHSSKNSLLQTAQALISSAGDIKFSEN